MEYNEAWHSTEVGCGDVHSKIIQHVSEVERAQSDTFDRFAKLAFLYDPTDESYDGRRSGPESQVITNVVASNVDTVASQISAAEVRCRFMTDDAEWSTQRRARHLEWYSDGLVDSLQVHKHARRAFKQGALMVPG